MGKDYRCFLEKMGIFTQALHVPFANDVLKLVPQEIAPYLHMLFLAWVHDFDRQKESAETASLLSKQYSKKI